MALTQVSTGGIKDAQVLTADIADAQITAAKLHADALDRTYTLGADGSNHYTFTGEGLTGAVNDPTLYLTRGKTYRFVNGNSAGAHPFRIQTTVNGSAGTEYNTGVTNNGGAGGSTIIFEVPHAAPDVLYYQCTSHGAMGGIFYITGALADGGVTTAKIADDAVTTDKLANAIVSDITANTAKTSLENNSVTTARIADEAVTLAKLEHGTSSNDGKFLRANNGADPTFETITVPTGVPTGGIILWSGAPNAIPTGFVICDGNNSTPDLRNRFVVGAGDTYSVDGTGGATTDSINISTYTSNAAQQTGNVRRTDQGAGTYMAFKTHAHQFSVQATIDTVPPYYALCYIMKT